MDLGKRYKYEFDVDYDAKVMTVKAKAYSAEDGTLAGIETMDIPVSLLARAVDGMRARTRRIMEALEERHIDTKELVASEQDLVNEIQQAYDGRLKEVGTDDDRGMDDRYMVLEGVLEPFMGRLAQYRH